MRHKHSLKTPLLLAALLVTSLLWLGGAPQAPASADSGTIDPAWPGNISGVVLDSRSHEELIGVKVVVLNTWPTLSAASDLQGAFRITTVPPGFYKLTVTALGFDRQLIDSVKVEAGIETRLDTLVLHSNRRPGADIIDLARKPSMDGWITGVVLDSLSRQPVIGANVIVLGSQPRRGAATDLDGKFRVPQVAPGTYAVQVTAMGYNRLRVDSVTVVAGLETMLGPLQLSPSVIRGEEIQLRAQRKAIQLDKAGQALNIASQSQVSASVGSTELSAQMPGFKVNGEGALHARGGRAGEFVAFCPSPQSGWNTEEYQHQADNGFMRVADDPLSTFSVDVDVASYTNLRRYLNQGALPPPDAVRTEELLNFFSYQYPEPEAGAPFSVSTELSDAPWAPGHRLLLVGLQGRHVRPEKMPPCNLVFLIDVSGSMRPENKLPLVQSSLRLLTEQLRPQDQIAIVVYAGAAGLALPRTSGNDKAAILAAIDRLQAGGSTAGGAGIQLAYQTARETLIPGGTNRIVWATDGDFNVGVSNTGDLVRLVEEQRQSGVSLSLLGFGMGNLKDSRLEQLADKGDGNYAYVDNFQEARRVLVGQMAGTLFTIAKDVKLQLEFNPAAVLAWRLIGYENRVLESQDFADDKKDAGEIGAGHSVTALYEIVPAGAPFPGEDTPLKYQVNKLTARATDSGELATVKLRYKEPGETESRLLSRVVADRPAALEKASADLRFASSVAELGLLLRHSPHAGAASFDALRRRAGEALAFDPEGYRAEFVRLAGLAQTLSAPRAPEDPSPLLDKR